MTTMMWTDDPLGDFDRWDAEQERELERLPICCECGNRIEDDFCYEINDEIICEACMEQYRKFTSDFMR